MATVKFNLKEVEGENSCEVTIKMTHDVAEDIFEIINSIYWVEITSTGSASFNSKYHIAKFTLTDKDKIIKLKNGIHNTYLKVNNHLN